MSKINEKELHELFNGMKNDEKNSFTSFYEKYYNLVYRIIFSILKNKENSEDIAQTVFSKIYQLPKDKLPRQYEASWIYKVSRNEALQYIRKSKNEVNIEEIYDVSDSNNNIDEIIDIETYKRMIEGLNEKEKEIVSLKVLSQFTFKKIGQMLKMPTATVQWRYYSAVNSLRVSLSSLAGFIVAIVLGVATTKRKNTNIINEKTKDNKINKSEINFESDTAEEKSPSTNKYTEITESIDLAGEQSTTATTEKQVSEPHINIGFYSISIIFLIIFLIFFKKYQQKRKVRASKS